MMLESSGIRCTIRNEYTAMTVGFGFNGPLGFATPELWVIDDDRIEDAQQILSEMKTVENSKTEEKFQPSSAGDAKTSVPEK